MKISAGKHVRHRTRTKAKKESLMGLSFFDFSGFRLCRMYHERTQLAALAKRNAARRASTA